MRSWEREYRRTLPKNYRKGLEFDRETKNEILARSICDECGLEAMGDNPWQVHHLIWVSYAYIHKIPQIIVTSPLNGSLKHESCHEQFHLKNENQPIEDVLRVLSLIPEQLELELGTMERHSLRYFYSLLEISNHFAQAGD